MIAMLVVGGVLLVFFVIYEMKWAEHPLMPLRVLNRTFLCCVIIDVFYFISGNLRSTFFSSWVYVIKDWSTQNWVFFNNTTTVGLCVFGLLAGAIQRATHRYKVIFRLPSTQRKHAPNSLHSTSKSLVWVSG